MVVDEHSRPRVVVPEPAEDRRRSLAGDELGLGPTLFHQRGRGFGTRDDLVVSGLSGADRAVLDQGLQVSAKPRLGLAHVGLQFLEVR